METLAKNINTVLIANRGEIASRIMRTCRKMGIKTIALFSEADKNAPYLLGADKAIHIGQPEPAKSYLDQEKIIEIAKKYQVDAIHPGYGFLSENAAFAEYCQRENIIFIGPNIQAIKSMGSKSSAKALMKKHQVPVIPGYQGADQSFDNMSKEAINIGFPILLKAAAGGGGKGMRIVHSQSDLQTAFDAAKREAKNAFGDDELIIEKYISRGRHIEFQIFGDQHGNVIHILERECSIQRRYQKIIEESPSPIMTDKLRQKMGKSAVAAAQALNYDNAGTVEFIYDDTSQNYYFLEVNTRLQVEHPVTEMITGLDLVELQLNSAMGLPLPLAQNDVISSGYAIESRLYAEDPNNDFMPGSGSVALWDVPKLNGLRVETAVNTGSHISIYYDPMIAKLIVWDKERMGAIRKLKYTLDNLLCLGLKTNQALLSKILNDPNFVSGKYDTNYIDENIGQLTEATQRTEQFHHALIASTLSRWQKRKDNKTLLQGLPPGWRNNFYQSIKDVYIREEEEYTLSYRFKSGAFLIHIGNNEYKALLIETSDHKTIIEVNGERIEFFSVQEGQDLFFQNSSTGSFQFSLQEKFPKESNKEISDAYIAPMPSQVIQVIVEVGAEVKKGDSLIVLSSMKMENVITAATAGLVTDIYVQANQNIESNQLLLKIEEQE